MTFMDMWVTMPPDNPGNNSSFYSSAEYDKQINIAKTNGDQATRLTP
ncbi:MAG: hypothetical protein ACM3ZA_02535 [Bacillota bacterium]